MSRKYLCPVCRTSQEQTLSDGLSGKMHFQIALSTLLVTGLLYAYDGLPLAWRGVLLYLPLWAGAEFLHGVKMREATKCRSCDFDPILYRRNPLEARRRVESKLNIIVEDLHRQISEQRKPYQKAASSEQKPEGADQPRQNNP